MFDKLRDLVPVDEGREDVSKQPRETESLQLLCSPLVDADVLVVESGLLIGGYGVLLAGSGAGGLISAVFNGQLTMSRRLTLVVVGAGDQLFAFTLQQ